MLYSIVSCHALRQRRAAMLALFESLALRFRCRSLLSLHRTALFQRAQCFCRVVSSRVGPLL
jgi:hypothetical protein